MKHDIQNYAADYANMLLRGNDLTARPWDIKKLCCERVKSFGRFLDIGCGTAIKTLRLSAYFASNVALEPSVAMLDKAKVNIAKSAAESISLVKGVSQRLPFLNKQFDLVTGILTFIDIAEVARTLKDSGIFIYERLGASDKTEFTRYFGKDKQGFRGAGLNHTVDSLLEETNSHFTKYFDEVEIIDGKWQTEYSQRGLWLLANNTVCTIRDFDPIKDKANFDLAVQELMVDNTVTLQQNRLLVIASKPLVKFK